MITFGTSKQHWNYFLALEEDLEHVSRYIEFTNDNLKTYSIELTHLLLSASSEIDVLLKQICKLLDGTSSPKNINDYRAIFRAQLPAFFHEKVCVNRYGLTFCPWENWKNNTNPNWWQSYNNVKHQRNAFFKEANLQNTLNAIGALLIAVVYYYKLSFSAEAGAEVSFKDTTKELQPDAKLITIDANYYFKNLVVYV